MRGADNDAAACADCDSGRGAAVWVPAGPVSGRVLLAGGRAVCSRVCQHVRHPLSASLPTAVHSAATWPDVLCNVVKCTWVGELNPQSDHLLRTGRVTLSRNGVRHEVKFQMALRRKSGLFPMQWQCRFKTLVNKGGLFLSGFYFCSCFIYIR